MFYEFEHYGLSDHFCKEYGTDFAYPNHLHQSFELITVTYGKMHITVDGKTYTVTPGKAVLIFPNQLHCMNGCNSKHMLFIFSPEYVKSFSTKTAGKVPISNLFEINNMELQYLEQIDENSSKIRKKGVLYTVCAEFDENAEYTDKKSDEYNLLFRIFDFVEKNYNKDCSLEKLSADTGFSYHYLSRYFKNSVSMTFNNYVNLYKISKACYLLNNTDCTVIRCALDCGYTSLRSFNRNFKLCTGLTPSEYRCNP